MKNTFVKVLSMMMALMMVVGMFSMITVSAAGCTHANATPSGAPVAPKCNAVGYTWYTCPDCGESFKADYTPVSNEHNLIPDLPNGVKEVATCTTNAWEAGLKCKDCGHEEKPARDLFEATGNVAYKAKGHVFGNGTITEKTLCTDAVYVVYLCTGCGKGSHELDPDGTLGYPKRVTLEEGATKHDWNKYVVKTAPVLPCDSAVVERTCKKCPAVETSTTPQNHVPATWTATTNGGAVSNDQYCGEYLSYKYCVYCGVKSDVVLNPNRNAHAKQEIKVMTDDLKNNVTFVNWCNANGKNYLNLDAGKTIGKPAKCYEEGYALYYCKHCNTYREETLAKINHVFNYVPETGSANGVCAPEQRVVKVCNEFGTNQCNVKEIVSIIKPAVQHVPVKDTANSKVATCVESGVTVTKCQNCGTQLSAQYSPALGHTWGAYFYSDVNGNRISFDCTKNIYQTRTCTVPNCPGKDISANPIHNACASHVMSTGSDYKIRQADCSSGEFGYYYCKNSELCNAYTKTAIEGTIIADKRKPDNHAPYNELTMTEIAGYRKNPTCTAAGEMTYVCSCGVELKRVLDPTGHPEDKLTNQNHLCKDGKTLLLVAAVVPTCTIEGFDAGVACTECETIVVARVSKGYNAAKHTNKDGVDTSNNYTITKHVDPTCLADGYNEIIYDDCCFARKTVKAGDRLSTCAAATVRPFEFKAPECTAKGTHEYKICTVCQKITGATIASCTYAGCTAESHSILSNKISAGVVTVADLELAPLGHDFTNKDFKVPYEPETCWKDGHTEYYECSRCDQHTAYSIIRKHARVTQPFAAKDATCFEAGLNAGNYCPKCINIENTPDYNDAHAGKAKRTHAYGATIVDGPDYVFVNLETYGGKPVDCTKPAYILKVCVQDKCGYVIMLENSFVPAKASHNWSVITKDYSVITEEGVDATGTQTYACWASGYTYKECADCDQQSNKASKNDQIKHYYYVEGKKVEIDTTCANISKYEGVRCALCDCEVVAANDAVSKYSVGTTIGSVHNYKWDKVNAKQEDGEWVATSCTEYGYATEYCVNCKKERVATITVAPLNPTLNPYKENDATKGIDLVSKTNPDGKVMAVIEHKAATASAAGYIKYVCALCDLTHTFNIPATTALVVSANVSANKVAAGETFTVTYALSGKAYEFATLDLQATVPANMTLIGIKSEYEGLVAVLAANGGISLVMPNDAEGNAQKVKTTAEGTALFTLTYSVNKTATYAVDQIITISDKSTKDNKLANANTAKITVTAVGNLNGDGLVSAEDAQAIFAKVGTNDVAADVNLDGIVNLSDVIALAKFAASAKTAADYLEMVGELDKLEDEVFALYDADRLNDVNGDKVVNISDAYALITKVETYLRANYNALGNNVTMAAVVAYNNVYTRLV